MTVYLSPNNFSQMPVYVIVGLKMKKEVK